jgi:hypothetical protein
MKAILRSFLFVLFIAPFASSYAQTGACGLYDIVVQNIRPGTQTSPSTCTVEFDAAFTLQANNGNKFIFFQTYVESPTGTVNQYPNYFKCDNTGNSTIKKPPVRGEIGTPLLNVAINANNLPRGQEPFSLENYAPDPTVPLRGFVPGRTLVDSFVLANGDVRFSFTNLQIVSPFPCGTPITLVSDVFATQAASASQVQCVTCGIRFSAGFLNITGGAITCDRYRFVLANATNQTITGTYRIFADNGNGILTTTGGQDVEILQPAGTPQTFTVEGRVGAETIITGTIPATLQGRDLFITITQGSGSAAPGAQRTVLLKTTVSCIPLPVNFSSFSASRNGTNVNLKWETATEENNKGFNVQRNSGRGWTDVGFVPSKANGGNSDTKLSYDFVDKNSERVVTQYRLRQEDLDGKFKVSEIRTVRGEAQESRVVVYPNPSNDGSINVLFDDARGNRDLILSDMNGRVVKQFRSVTTSNLRMDNLTPGVYSLRIVNQSNGKATIEKIVINR